MVGAWVLAARHDAPGAGIRRAGIEPQEGGHVTTPIGPRAGGRLCARTVSSPGNDNVVGFFVTPASAAVASAVILRAHYIIISGAAGQSTGIDIGARSRNAAGNSVRGGGHKIRRHSAIDVVLGLAQGTTDNGRRPVQRDPA